MSIGPDTPTAEPSPSNEGVVLVGGVWDGWEFEFATPELEELWYRDADLTVNQVAGDAAEKAYDPDTGRLDPDVLFSDVLRNMKKKAYPTTASVYRRRAGTSKFDFVRSEPGEVLDRLESEGYFDGTVRRRGC